MVVGVDTETVYTRKDVAGEELEGEPDLLGYVRLPKDLCVALTQETNGSVFRCAVSVLLISQLVGTTSVCMDNTHTPKIKPP